MPRTAPPISFPGYSNGPSAAAPIRSRAKDCYGCSHRKKRLPVEELGGACCSNAKTIKRQDVEARVLSAACGFFSMGIFEKIADEARRRGEVRLRSGPSEHAKRTGELKQIGARQKAIIQQIGERAHEGRPRLPALDDALDKLEFERVAAERLVAASKPDDNTLDEKLAEVHHRPKCSNLKPLERTQHSIKPGSKLLDAHGRSF